jgi:hypothetical protein
MRRGGCAVWKESRSHLYPRRRGGVDQQNLLLDQHHPGRAYNSVAFGTIFLMARPPLLI